MNNDVTIDDAIDYFKGVLDDGGVCGTDFELTEYEIKIYERTIGILEDYGMEYGFR